MIQTEKLRVQQRATKRQKESLQSKDVDSHNRNRSRSLLNEDVLCEPASSSPFGQREKCYEYSQTSVEANTYCPVGFYWYFIGHSINEHKSYGFAWICCARKPIKKFAHCSFYRNGIICSLRTSSWKYIKTNMVKKIVFDPNVCVWVYGVRKVIGLRSMVIFILFMFDVVIPKHI